MIELSREDFAALHRQAAVGRLVQGLVHNLNGPLQNLGMDMDMIQFGLNQGGESLEALLEDVSKRLGRMESEFEQVNRLIRATAAHSAPDGDAEAYMTLADFLDQEISFLKANLYFKHHVQTEILLDKSLPPIRRLPPGVVEGLSSLLQALVEETERREMTVFALKASGNESAAEVRIATGPVPLSEPFLGVLYNVDAYLESFRVEEADTLVPAYAAMMLATAGVTPQVESGAEETRLTLRFQGGGDESPTRSPRGRTGPSPSRW